MTPVVKSASAASQSMPAPYHTPIFPPDFRSLRPAVANGEFWAKSIGEDLKIPD
jgi:hypothetical protein